MKNCALRAIVANDINFAVVCDGSADIIVMTVKHNYISGIYIVIFWILDMNMYSFLVLCVMSALAIQIPICHANKVLLNLKI